MVSYQKTLKTEGRVRAADIHHRIHSFSLITKPRSEPRKADLLVGIQNLLSLNLNKYLFGSCKRYIDI